MLRAKEEDHSLSTDRACQQEGNFKENNNYKEIASTNEKMTVKMFVTHHPERRHGEVNTHKTY